MVVTGNSDRENALRAIRHGAFDYYAKPIELEEFKVILRRAAHLGRLEQESETWLRGQEDAIRFEEILGATPAMREIFRIIQRVAKSDATEPFELTNVLEREAKFQIDRSPLQPPSVGGLPMVPTVGSGQGRNA